jgi:hypothetical protein
VAPWGGAGREAEPFIAKCKMIDSCALTPVAAATPPLPIWERGWGVRVSPTCGSTSLLFAIERENDNLRPMPRANCPRGHTMFSNAKVDQLVVSLGRADDVRWLGYRDGQSLRHEVAPETPAVPATDDILR